jgi:hypothetical protein
MKIKLGKAIAFLPQTNIDIEKASQEFFGEIDLSELDASDEIIQGLFGEWLLFDYEPKNGKTLISQYYSKNQDNLSKIEISELEQIIKTQSLHLLQTYSKSKPPYSFLQSIFTGKKFKVYDKSLSLSIDDNEGCFLGRIAKINKVNYLVGASSLFLPIRHTERSIQMFVKEKMPTPTLKDALLNFTKPKEMKPKKVMNIGLKQKRLEKKYQKEAKKFKSKVSFQEIVDFVYNEDYGDNIADYITDLMKLGVPDEMCLKHIEMLYEIWNYFPHKKTGGKSPVELSREN